jgi:hypothetical protein
MIVSGPGIRASRVNVRDRGNDDAVHGIAFCVAIPGCAMQGVYAASDWLLGASAALASAAAKTSNSRCVRTG